MASLLNPLGGSITSPQLSTSSLTASGEATFDWNSEENVPKWKGHFTGPLQKILSQVHPHFTADDESLYYVESLLIKLLSMMTAKPGPSTVADIEERVSRTFPTPIDKWALAEAQRALDRGKKKSTLVLPLDKVHALLKEVLHNSRLDDQLSLFIVAVLDYIAADILKLAGNYVKNIRHQVITCQDIKVAMCADKVLMDMFMQEDPMMLYTEEETSTRQTYDEVVKDLIMDEKQYLRDLHMITKVFRDLLVKNGIATASEIDAIFSNINDVTELTMTLIGSLEDTVEMTEEGNAPAVGSCFEELAEGEEFDVYEKYAQAILSLECRQALDSLIGRPDVNEKLIASGKGFREAVKFYLPKLLLGPVYHCFNYFKYNEMLMNLTHSKDDADSLKQVAAMITPLQNKLQILVQQAGSNAKRKPGEIYPRCGATKVSRQMSLQKLNQLQQTISNWEGKDIASNSAELVCEGRLKVMMENRKRWAERYVFLCDGMIIICKANKKGGVGSLGGGGSNSGADLKLRDKHLIRRVDVADREDTDDLKYTFELVPRDQSRIIFKAESAEEKNSWMAALVMLNTKSMLERHLDSILAEEEKKHPLRFPPSDKYRFAEPNTPENIVYEEKEKSNGIPLIKGATLIKLVERLTFHTHADPMFMKTFLTTYRDFSNPTELLDLLIERFNVPEPEFSSDSESDSEFGEKKSKIQVAQDMKRFRKEYSQPVQFRVLNVLKHWVDQHFYDFEQDNDLLHKLTSFLDTISGKNMKKWVDCIIKIVQRRLSNEEATKDIIFDFDRSPPPIEIHIEHPEPGWPELLTYHPIEIARQLTLLEFHYYRAVKPSELVDLAWTREDKDKRSPNLLRMVRHTNAFTLYLEKLIVEAENLEERVAVITRILEIMVVLLEYNNFHGVIATTSVLNSSAVHRLVLHKDKIPNHLLKALEEASSFVPNHYKVYWERLRSLNPPCVPFLGQYQTNILFLQEGNQDFLDNTELNTKLINFTKRRKVAEIISEIQQYQNQPYCLEPYPKLKSFLESLEPFAGMSQKETEDYLWKKSIEIEPRDLNQRKKTDAKPKWKGLNLRSPGIKPKNLTGKTHPNPLPHIRKPSRASQSQQQSQQNENGSPLTSPVFRSSPQSGPPTPLNHSNSANMMYSPVDADPIMVPVILPNSSGNHHQAAPPVQPPPPPLPPKPPRGGFFHLPHYGHNHHHHQHHHNHHHQDGASSGSNTAPPIMVRQASPPPPLPPRQYHQQQSIPPIRLTPTKAPLESRSPLMDPVIPRRNSGLGDNHFMTSPPPALVPRRHSTMNNGLQAGTRYPPPLNLRTGSEGASPSTSPLWPSPSPSAFSGGGRFMGPASATTIIGHSPGLAMGSYDANSNNPNSATSTNHFTFNQTHISGVGVGGAPGPPPRPPPHRSSSSSATGSSNASSMSRQ